MVELDEIASHILQNEDGQYWGPKHIWPTAVKFVAALRRYIIEYEGGDYLDDYDLPSQISECHMRYYPYRCTYPWIECEPGWNTYEHWRADF